MNFVGIVNGRGRDILVLAAHSELQIVLDGEAKLSVTSFTRGKNSFIRCLIYYNKLSSYKYISAHVTKHNG